MSKMQTWRVVLESGEVKRPEVEDMRDGSFVAVTGEDGDHYAGLRDEPRLAVAALCDMAGWPVVELLAPGEPTAAERLAVVTAERDALAAAVREVAESEGALETMIDDSGWTLDDERIAEERVAAAHAALDAALAAAEGR